MIIENKMIKVEEEKDNKELENNTVKGFFLPQ